MTWERSQAGLSIGLVLFHDSLLPHQSLKPAGPVGGNLRSLGESGPGEDG